MGERQPEDSFVCFGAKPTQKACARDFLRNRKKTRKGEVPGQSTEGVSDSWGKVTVRERRPVDPEAGSASLRG